MTMTPFEYIMVGGVLLIGTICFIYLTICWIKQSYLRESDTKIIKGQTNKMTKENIPSTDKETTKTPYNSGLIIYGKLDAPLFIKRMEGSFPSIHLNGVSIIQGIALGLLCEQTFRKISEKGLNIWTDAFQTGNQADPIKYYYIFVTLVCIICVLYEYNWFIGIYRWSHTVIDTSIPIFIGFFEIAAILNITYDHRNWWFYISLFSFFGTIGFINTFMNLKIDMFDDKIFITARRNAKKSICIAAAATLFAFAIYLCFPANKCVLIKDIIDCKSEIIEIIFLSLYLSPIIYIIYRDGKFIKDIHDQLK